MHSDLRLAIRSLFRAPAFTAVVIATFALGIGANTAIFSFFHAILLRELPYADPDRVVIVKNSPTDYSEPMGVEIGLLAADFRELQTAVESFDALAAYTLDSATLTGREAPDLTVGTVVTRNFFSMLGAGAAIGRTFTESDGPESGRLIVLGHGFWLNRLGADSSIVGRPLTLNNVSFTVVGIMPAAFEFPREAQFWATPAADIPENTIGQPVADFNGRGNYVRTILGRVKAGVSIAAAEQELAAAVARLPNPNQTRREIHLVNMRDQSVGAVRRALTMVLACAGLVLLIACLNVSNLMLSRASAREREFAVRLALGGGRWQIARQALVEAVVLALIGGIAGIALSGWTLDALVAAAPESLPRLHEVRLDLRVMAFAFVISLAAGIGCGLAPVLATDRAGLVALIHGGDRGPGLSGGGSRRFRSSLVATEVAIALVLLVAGGLLVRSLSQMQAASWGFTPAHVVSARVAFLDERYSTPEAQRTFARALFEKLETEPGFQSVGTSLDRIGAAWITLPFAPEGNVYATPGDRPQANYHLVSHDYLQTLGVQLVQGRHFTREDDENTRNVVIIDANMARRHFADGNAVGRRIEVVRFKGDPWVEVIGVVAPIATDGPGASQYPDLYTPFAQTPWNHFYVHVRTPLDPPTVGAALSRIVRGIDASVPVTDVASMEQVTSRPAQARVFPLGLIGAFAGLALLLAALGVHAVTSFGVARRTREIGVRMALGADRRSVLALVIRQAMKPVTAGLAGGIVAAVATALAMRGLLFGIEPIDGPTFLAIPVILAAVAVVACWLPARRATKIDPAIALRAE
ncbi:MAG TPA: ABC transporter permease [Opitutaceae bacterium]|nr:ABC transporter permease [Opitutaceae bacterium]